MSSNPMVLFQGGAVAPLSNKFQAMVQAGAGMDLGEGIRSSYGIVGIKGGKFRVRYKGEERMLTMPHPQDPTQTIPVSFIDVVIVKANAFLNKQYYKGNYVEGSDSPPDCYSLNGKTPSPQVQQPVHTNCAMCPANQFGSKIGDNGQKQKACRDTKKLALVPLADIRNAGMGGAMLFRVPPSALKDLSVMADALKGKGYPYNSVAVRIGFDTTVSHPKPTFQALRPLNDDEADLVFEMISSDSVEAVLNDGDDLVVAGPANVPASAQFLQPGPVAPPAGAQPVNTHGWQPGQPLPRIDPATVPPVNPAAAQPAPQRPGGIINQPVTEGQPLIPGQHVPLTHAPPGAVAVQPFNPGQPAPPPPAQMHTPVQNVQPQQLILQPEQPAPAPAAASANPFAAPSGVQQAAKPATPRRAPVQPVAAPTAAAPEPAPASAGQLDDEISNILGGLSDFMGGK
jgi:hypothetical protein